MAELYDTIFQFSLSCSCIINEQLIVRTTHAWWRNRYKKTRHWVKCIEHNVFISAINMLAGNQNDVYHLTCTCYLVFNDIPSCPFHRDTEIIYGWFDNSSKVNLKIPFYLDDLFIQFLLHFIILYIIILIITI